MCNDNQGEHIVTCKLICNDCNKYYINCVYDFIQAFGLPSYHICSKPVTPVWVAHERQTHKYCGLQKFLYFYEYIITFK